jgi:murein DD-endopeptidase MepM/ murein hydrolase activator NlpD
VLFIWTAISLLWFFSTPHSALDYEKKIEEERIRYEEELLSLSLQAEDTKTSDKNLENRVHALFLRTQSLQARQMLLSALTERLHRSLTSSLPLIHTEKNAPIQMDSASYHNEETLHELAQDNSESEEDFEGPIYQKPIPLAEDDSESSPHDFSESLSPQQSPSFARESVSLPFQEYKDAIPSASGQSLEERITQASALTQKIDTHAIESLHKLALSAHQTRHRLASILSRVGVKNKEIPEKNVGGPFVPVSMGALKSSEDFSNLIHVLKQSTEDILRLTHILEYIPVTSPKAGTTAISSSFGVRSDPFTRSMAMHTGIDMRMARGTPVYATAAGRVSKAHVLGGYGLLVEIEHGYGFRTRYAHLSRAHVAIGQRVQRGAHIGSAGSSGRSTGPHLHYEVRTHGRPINPTPFLNAFSRSFH